ncbi:MAG: alanine--tRNA ligase [Candidatus Omnitrophota bacterium]|jgi:alanyl-tRNA synthetase
MKADILREKFLKFFESKGHRICESDSLFPKDDPTVLFTPAGMNQFKKEFLGYDSGFKRAATSQRCLRTDDLDKVGKTRGHHTFFEMLGNFSFGDYFKKEAIAWAWEFLTKELGLSAGKLWVSVYKDDDEAYDIWKNDIKVPLDRIVKLGDKENFWPSEAKEKGPNGPCGPCSEMFFDRGNDIGCKKSECSPACGCGRFLEVWNLVFTQFNRRDNGVLEPLPHKNIDTGMGLERLAAVMQGVESNFESDLFEPLIREIALNLRNAGLCKDKEFIYAVSDHVRAVVFSIYDGVLPSNESRGYIVRKLIRKSTLHLRSMGMSGPFLYKLVPLLSEIMKSPYPELVKRREDIAQVVLSEEKNFINTLNSSEPLLKEKFSVLEKKTDHQEAGRIAFQLYDTYGIPLELTMDWAEKQGIEISTVSFERELNLQKSRSKAQSTMQGDVFSDTGAGYNLHPTAFLGYEKTDCLARIIKILVNGQEMEEAAAGAEEVSVILDSTVFYGESGGQVGDTGTIESAGGVFEVQDTKVSNKVIMHVGRLIRGALKKGESVHARIQADRRMAIARNHTAAHLLQAALRKVLGAHVQQQGSLVEERRLRFDFTHFRDIKDEELFRIEELANEFIMNDYRVLKTEMSLQDARTEGALAFFAEKYGEKVRVISVGDISKELCGGTHLDATGQIGMFRIIQESSIASGVRRIEAATGKNAYAIMKEHDTVLAGLVSSWKVPVDRIRPEQEKRDSLIKELEKQLNAQKLQNLAHSLDAWIRGAEQINGITFIARQIENYDMGLLRKAVDLIKERQNDCFVTLGVVHAGQVLVVAGTNSASVLRHMDLPGVIRENAVLIGGSGGGRKDFAQAGGTKPDKLPEFFEKLKEIIRAIPNP